MKKQRKKHIIGITIKAFAAIISAVISGIITYTLFFQSDFKELIPTNTQSFAHVRKNSAPPYLEEFFKNSQILRNNNFHQTFLKSEERKESILTENISKKESLTLLSKLSQKGIVWDSEILSFYENAEWHCTHKRRKLFCSESLKIIQQFLDKDFVNTVRVESFFKNIKKQDNYFWTENSVFELPLAQIRTLDYVSASFEENIGQIFIKTNEAWYSSGKEQRKDLSNFFNEKEVLLIVSANNFSAQWQQFQTLLKENGSDFEALISSELTEIINSLDNNFAIALTRSGIQAVFENSEQENVSKLFQKLIEQNIISAQNFDIQTKKDFITVNIAKTPKKLSKTSSDQNGIISSELFPFLKEIKNVFWTSKQYEEGIVIDIKTSSPRRGG